MPHEIMRMIQLFLVALIGFVIDTVNPNGGPNFRSALRLVFLRSFEILIYLCRGEKEGYVFRIVLYIILV
jgi:hypothetical protein